MPLYNGEPPKYPTRENTGEMIDWKLCKSSEWKLKVPVAILEELFTK